MSARGSSARKMDLQPRKRTYFLSFFVNFLLLVATLHFRRFNESKAPSSLRPLTRKPLDDSLPRFLTLGSSSSFGVGLELPAKHSFAALLGNGHNLASQVGEPTLAALCTQSILSTDQAYDVIILEFSTKEDVAALNLLARRLRERFPAASILLVDLWSPSDFAFLDESFAAVNFDTWRTNRLLEQAEELDSESFLRAVSHIPWFIRPDVEHRKQIQRIADDIHGIVYALPEPGNATEALQQINYWYQEGPTGSDPSDLGDDDGFRYVLSSNGHELLAHAIMNMLDPQSIVERPNRNQLGSWGSGDACQLWYDTTPIIQPVPKSSSLRWVGFSGKTALEVSEQGGSLFVENPFSDGRMVHLTYMTSNDPSMYPRLQIQFGKSRIILDPSHDDIEEMRHLTRTTAIGWLPAGESLTISLKPLSHSRLPFRVAGLSLFCREREDYLVATEYAFEPEAVVVSTGGN